MTTKVKGAAILARQTFVGDEYGEGAWTARSWRSWARVREKFSAIDCLTVIGWYKEALEMCGAGSVEMSEEECRAKGGSFCRYRVSWTS